MPYPRKNNAAQPPLPRLQEMVDSQIRQNDEDLQEMEFIADRFETTTNEHIRSMAATNKRAVYAVRQQAEEDLSQRRSQESQRAATHAAQSASRARLFEEELEQMRQNMRQQAGQRRLAEAPIQEEICRHELLYGANSTEANGLESDTSASLFSQARTSRIKNLVTLFSTGKYGSR